MRENARFGGKDKIGTITVKIEPEKRAWFQAYAFHIGVTGEALLRQKVAAYLEATAAGQVPFFVGSRRPKAPGGAISYCLRLRDQDKDRFVKACESNGATPSIVIRDWIDDLAQEATGCEARNEIAKIKAERDGDPPAALASTALVPAGGRRGGEVAAPQELPPEEKQRRLENIRKMIGQGGAKAEAKERPIENTEEYRAGLRKHIEWLEQEVAQETNPRRVAKLREEIEESIATEKELKAVAGSQ